MIVAVEGLGSVVKVDKNEEGFGFITVVNLTLNKVSNAVAYYVTDNLSLCFENKECIKQIEDFILGKISDAQKKEQLKQILQVGSFCHHLFRLTSCQRTIASPLD